MIPDNICGSAALTNLTIKTITAIPQGLSADRKYLVETTDGGRLFLRVSLASNAARKRAEYAMTAHAYAHGIPTPEPLGFGMWENGESCYALFRWIDGTDAYTKLADMPPQSHYALGEKTGELLRRIHSVPLPAAADVTPDPVGRKIAKWLALYDENTSVHCETGETIVRFLTVHRHMPPACPQTFIHGDYNPENIITGRDGAVSVIDFNSYNAVVSDPWSELANMAWMPVLYPRYHAGQIDAYFGGEPPDAFWQALRRGLALDALAALTDSYGLNGVDNGLEIAGRILAWMDGFRNLKPTWYTQ